MDREKDCVLEKKLGAYNCEEDNFIACQEITVTITLNEYRKLITRDATAEFRIKKAEEDKYNRNALNDKLKKENDELRAKLMNYQEILERAGLIRTVNVGDAGETGSDELD